MLFVAREYFERICPVCNEGLAAHTCSELVRCAGAFLKRG